MIKHSDSHVDHGLTDDQLRYLLDRFADRQAFFIETFELPEDLGTVPCGLYGPTMGDAAIGEDEVRYEKRGKRTWNSRLVERPTRPTRKVSVIAGPHEEICTTCNGKLFSLASPGQDTKGWCAGCDHCGCTGKLKYDCILYTAFGGPVAPQEPDDPGCKDRPVSAAFWREHALSR